jgi:hypothetical protein
MADSFLDFLARLLRPVLLPLARRLARPKHGATWHYEAAFVALALITVAVLTSPALAAALAGVALKEFLIIWLSALAVFCSFLHAQVGTYMAEDMSHTEIPLTPCFHKLGEYWVYKEILWFLVFFISGAYPAIAGSVIFLLFPVWRKIYKQERQRIAKAHIQE